MSRAHPDAPRPSNPPPAEEVEDSDEYEEESEIEEEYPEGDIRMLADALITSNGEAIADVMAGIRDALEKLTKVVYTASKHGKQ